MKTPMDDNTNVLPINPYSLITIVATTLVHGLRTSSDVGFSTLPRYRWSELMRRYELEQILDDRHRVLVTSSDVGGGFATLPKYA